MVVALILVVVILGGVYLLHRGAMSELKKSQRMRGHISRELSIRELADRQARPRGRS